MKRLGLPIAQMRQTPYGIAVGSGQSVIVPEGVYSVVVGENEVAQDGVRVNAGQATTLDLKAAQPSG
jgi:hypothetical protein